MKTKYCKSCNTHQPLDNFWKDKHRTDGLKRLCKPCMKAYVKGMTLDQYKKYLEFKKEPAAKPQAKQELEQVHYTHFNKRKMVVNYHRKAKRIRQGLEEDDYKNHFFSHFGFFDVAPDQDKQDKIGLQSAYGGKYNNYPESKGIG